jgi:hypothetical protein
MKTPRLFAVPALDPVPLVGSEGNVLRRCQYALTPDEYVELLEQVSPARFQLGSPALAALETYVFNRVGPLFPRYHHIAQRDHFLPHTGLWGPTRQFADPRMMTQIWRHTAAHEWYGWPLPVSTTFGRYQTACYEGEILAVVESEFRFFEEGGHMTDGMFNPAYPSTYEALRAVGVTSPEAAYALLHEVQFNGGKFPHEVVTHPAYKGGVAVTLHRQASWPEHDEAFTQAHWRHQRRAGYSRAYNTLWAPDRQESIFARQKLGHAGILLYGESTGNRLDPLEGARAVVKSMLRVMALDVVQHAWVDQDRAFGRIASMFADAVDETDVAALRATAEAMPETYDNILGYQYAGEPAPLWDLAMEFREFRVAWEARLKEKTEIWTTRA